MTVDKLTKAEFDAFKPSRGPLVGTLIIEKEWYADGNRNVIGTLTLDATDKDWGYVVLGRGQKGIWRGVDFAVSISSQDGARAELQAKLGTYGDSGKKVFPQ